MENAGPPAYRKTIVIHFSVAVCLARQIQIHARSLKLRPSMLRVSIDTDTEVRPTLISVVLLLLYDNMPHIII